MAKLGDICALYSGTGFPVQYQGNSTGQYPFYKVGDIAKNVIQGLVFLSLCENYIDEDVCRSIKGTIIPQNTIVFAKIGEAVKLNRRAITTAPCLIDNNAMGIQPNEDYLNLGYFYHFMCNLKLEQYAEATTVPSVKKTVIEKIDIPLPPLETQKQIAANLDKATQTIDLCNAILEKLDLLVKARFVEMFGDMVANDKQWHTFRLTEVSDIVSGITKGRKIKETKLIEVPYMAVSNVKDGYIDWTTVKTILATESEIAQYRIIPEDILMTEGGDPDKLGRGSIIYQVPENCIHQNHIFRVRLNQKKIAPVFFAEYLKHQGAKQYFLKCAKQTTGIASINMTQLKALPVFIPPIELQKLYAAFVEKTDRTKAAVKQVLAKAETLKKALMQEYFG